MLMPDTESTGSSLESLLYRILENISRVEGMLLMQRAPTGNAPVQDVAAFPAYNPFDQIDLF